MYVQAVSIATLLCSGLVTPEFSVLQVLSRLLVHWQLDNLSILYYIVVQWSNKDIPKYHGVERWLHVLILGVSLGWLS